MPTTPPERPTGRPPVEPANLGGGVWLVGSSVVYRADFNSPDQRWVVMRPPWVAYTGARGLIPWLRDAIEADKSWGYRTLGKARAVIAKGSRNG